MHIVNPPWVSKESLQWQSFYEFLDLFFAVYIESQLVISFGALFQTFFASFTNEHWDEIVLPFSICS